MMNLDTLSRPIRALMALLFAGSLAMSLQAQDNLALNKPATASSQYSSSYGPSAAVDGNLNTYWATAALSSIGSTHWLAVDLQSAYDVNQATIKFSVTNFPKSWKIQYLNDSTWTDAYSVTSNTSGGTKTVSFPTVNAQIFRVYMTSNAGSYYTIYELQLFGQTSDTYSLTTIVNPTSSGTITRSPYATSYAPGEVVTLTATPATNYIFSGWSGDATGTSSTIQITMDSNKNVTATFKASGTNCGIPPFNPTPWNDGSTIQRNNNCYNYSNNVKTNTFAQPGRYCGHMATSMTCAQVIAAAKCDGLVQTTKDAVLPPGMTRIALVVADGEDYHWYRQDSNGMWSHKPGQTKAVNVDNSNKPISDPETADRGFYNSFCVYFQICSGEEQFGGHSTIK